MAFQMILANAECKYASVRSTLKAMTADTCVACRAGATV